jgi:hypothetical protein
VENSTDISEDPFLRKAKLYLHFVENPGNVADPSPDAVDPDDEHNPKNIPGRCSPSSKASLTSLPCELRSSDSLKFGASMIDEPKNINQASSDCY